MAYIQVCPQYAKSIQYYASFGPELNLKKGDATCLVLYPVKDGSDPEKEPQDVQFSRVGDYSVKHSITASADEFALKWMDSNVRTLEDDWTYVKSTANNFIRCTERLVALEAPVSVGLRIRAKEDVIVYKALVVVEYLD